MIGMLGKKLGMTRLFKEDGEVIPVTVIEAGPCHVLQVKTSKLDGYGAVQLGFDAKKEKRTNKALKGHFKKSKVKPARFIRELRTDSEQKYEVGQAVTVDIFQENDLVDVIGISIGKGFQGGVKRWGWQGGRASHGSMHHRAPGSIGASSFPSRVFKGHHMPGRMGGERKTMKNLEVVRVDKDNNLLVVKGCVPGHKNSYLLIREAKKHPIRRVAKKDEGKIEKDAKESSVKKESPK